MTEEIASIDIRRYSPKDPVFPDLLAAYVGIDGASAERLVTTILASGVQVIIK